MEHTPKHTIVVRRTELLAVTAGRVRGRPVAILTLRPDPECSFGHVNMALSRDQAWRLMEDLANIFESSTALKE